MGSRSDGRMGVHHSAVCHFGMQSTAVAHAARLSKHVNGLLALLVTDTAPCEKLQRTALDASDASRFMPMHAACCLVLPMIMAMPRMATMAVAAAAQSSSVPKRDVVWFGRLGLCSGGPEGQQGGRAAAYNRQRGHCFERSTRTIRQCGSCTQ